MYSIWVVSQKALLLRTPVFMRSRITVLWWVGDIVFLMLDWLTTCVFVCGCVCMYVCILRTIGRFATCGCFLWGTIGRGYAYVYVLCTGDDTVDTIDTRDTNCAALRARFALKGPVSWTISVLCCAVLFVPR